MRTISNTVVLYHAVLKYTHNMRREGTWSQRPFWQEEYPGLVETLEICQVSGDFCWTANCKLSIKITRVT